MMHTRGSEAGTPALEVPSAPLPERPATPGEPSPVPGPDPAPVPDPGPPGVPEPSPPDQPKPGAPDVPQTDPRGPETPESPERPEPVIPPAANQAARPPTAGYPGQTTIQGGAVAARTPAFVAPTRVGAVGPLYLTRCWPFVFGALNGRRSRVPASWKMRWTRLAPGITDRSHPSRVDSAANPRTRFRPEPSMKVSFLRSRTRWPPLRFSFAMRSLATGTPAMSSSPLSRTQTCLGSCAPKTAICNPGTCPS